MVLNDTMHLTLKELTGSVDTLKKVSFKQLSLEEMKAIVVKASGMKLKAMIWNEENQGECFGAIYDKANAELVIMAPEIVYDNSISSGSDITPANKVTTYDLTGITFAKDLKEIDVCKGFWSAQNIELNKKVELPKADKFNLHMCTSQADEDKVVDFSNFVLNPYNFLKGEEKCKNSRCIIQLIPTDNGTTSKIRKVILPENLFVPEDYICGFLFGFDVEGVDEIVIPNEVQWRKESAKIEEETGIKNMLFDIIEMYNDADTKKRFLGYRDSLNFNEKALSNEEMIYNKLFYFSLRDRAKDMMWGRDYLHTNPEFLKEVEKATKMILKTA